MDEIIKAIMHANTEQIQDIVHAVICRYKELYPDWRMMFVSVDANATDERSGELLELIRKADGIFNPNMHGNLNEK